MCKHETSHATEVLDLSRMDWPTRRPDYPVPYQANFLALSHTGTLRLPFRRPKGETFYLLWRTMG